MRDAVAAKFLVSFEDTHLYELGCSCGQILEHVRHLCGVSFHVTELAKQRQCLAVPRWADTVELAVGGSVAHLVVGVTVRVIAVWK